jgi:anti-sigma factor RsiW
LKEEAMHKPFDDLLDQITELRCNVATSSDTRLERRVARLEHIVQQMLLALVEATPREKR